MNRTTAALAPFLLLFAWGCGEGDRQPPPPEDCSIEEGYEFLNIANFAGEQSGWYRYVDPTPGGIPDVSVESNVPVTEHEAPGRCGDTRLMVLEAEGLNFWGSGFADWAHNDAASRADGTGYDGISFWARSPANAEKQFLLNVDDGQTIAMPPDPPAEGGLPVATPADQDLDGDGFIGAGDIVGGTTCRLPPTTLNTKVACYGGGVATAPSGADRVPEWNECGNAFHTRVTTSETWQLFLIPWAELVQWPCPNRLENGIDPADIARLEIKFVQGTRYELWIDNFAFYRRR